MTPTLRLLETIDATGTTVWLAVDQIEAIRPEWRDELPPAKFDLDGKPMPPIERPGMIGIDITMLTGRVYRLRATLDEFAAALRKAR